MNTKTLLLIPTLGAAAFAAGPAVAAGPSSFDFAARPTLQVIRPYQPVVIPKFVFGGDPPQYVAPAPRIAPLCHSGLEPYINDDGTVTWRTRVCSND